MGTDDGCCNDSVNLLADMKVLACLHRAAREDPSVVTAEQIVELATVVVPPPWGWPIALARLSQASSPTWSCSTFRRAHLVPAANLPAVLVWQANGSEVDTVLVDGDSLSGMAAQHFLQRTKKQALYTDASSRAAAIAFRWPG